MSMFHGVLTAIVVANMSAAYPIEQQKDIDFRTPYKIVMDDIDRQTQENRRKAEEELLQKKDVVRRHLEKAKKRIEEEKKKKNTVTFELTCYTRSECENMPGKPSVTCTGKQLVDGMVASNYYKLGTKIEIDGKIYTVADTGGASLNDPTRLDVFLENLPGESNEACRRRAFKIGRIHKPGVVLEA